MQLDERLASCARASLLRLLIADPDTECLVLYDGGKIAGYGMSRPGRLARYFGPIVAHSEAVGCQLLYDLLCRRPPSETFMVDVPCDSIVTLEWLASIGGEPVRSFKRMAYGDPVVEDDTIWFVSSGPEKG